MPRRASSRTPIGSTWRQRLSPAELVIDTITKHVDTVDWLFDVVAQRRAL